MKNETIQKEIPILFSGPMVRAILEGRKTQTRRIINPQPTSVEYWKHGKHSDNRNGIVSLRDSTGKGWGMCGPFRCKFVGDGMYASLGGILANSNLEDKTPRKSLLWVRETFSYWAHSFESVGIEYAAGGEDKIVNFPDKNGMPSLEAVCQNNIAGGRRKRPSIFMPRWASRITLEVIRVRVERLQEITEDDALEEGVEPYTPHVTGMLNGREQELPSHAYATLWESINGKGSWDKNPWVWVIEFKKVSSTKES